MNILSVTKTVIVTRENMDSTNLICRDVDHPGEDMGALYAQEVRNICAKLLSQGKKPSCFIAESLQSCGGTSIDIFFYLP